MLDYLDADAEGSARGTDDPLKMAVGALNAGRSLLKKIVADGGITEESWLAELRGWFEPLVEGLASGPPAQRIEQLAALARAGIVQFAGPEPVYQVDPDTGRFRRRLALGRRRRIQRRLPGGGDDAGQPGGA